jgi:serine/alanine adding enzyme
VFDFGRSSANSSTFRFKQQWGTAPQPAEWQFYERKGAVGDMRLESGKYALLIRLWQRLPLSVTRLIGPPIVRGIP